MTQRKALILSAVALIGGILFAPAVLAEEEPKDTTNSVETVKQRLEEAKKEAEKKRAEIQEKTEALREKVKDQREQIKTKLDDRRLDICKKRQAAINNVTQNSTGSANKHLTTFQTIEARVKEFVTNKNLTVENYDALLANVDAKEAAAIAAIKVAGETTFSCDVTDPVQPGGIIRGLVQSQHSALKEYRTAIKDLIVAVKHTSGKEEQS